MSNDSFNTAELDRVIKKLLEKMELKPTGMGQGAPNAKAGDLLNLARSVEVFTDIVQKLYEKVESQTKMINALGSEVVQLKKLNEDKDKLNDKLEKLNLEKEEQLVTLKASNQHSKYLNYRDAAMSKDFNAAVINAIKKDKAEVNKKEMNVVVTNVPESSDPHKDEQVVQLILDTVGVGIDQVNKTSRIGRGAVKQNDGAIEDVKPRPRPILIAFKTADSAKKALSQSSNLRRSDDLRN